MKKVIWLSTLIVALFLSFSVEAKPETSDREYWSDLAYKISYPVLDALSKGELKKRMPVEQRPNPSTKREHREHFTHLEALARLLCGISPWLELSETSGEEKEYRQREELKKLAIQGIRKAVDPSSPDYMDFTGKYDRQPLVNAAFLAQAFLRAPNALWGGLDNETQRMVIAAMRKTRKITPYFNNWLLFSAMVEAFFLEVGEGYDEVRIDYALRQHEQWYKGDGLYGDGPDFYWNYYNSFVIQPMILDISRIMLKHEKIKKNRVTNSLNRSARYASILERLISPEGTYPAIGRSLAYRMGAFQSLAQMALMKQLPEHVSPAQVRGALTAVMKRQMTAEGTFDENGWLRIGFDGSQPYVGEYYISTGSLYLCSVALLPLGLPPSDEFWSAPEQPWTQKKIWNGQEVPIDHAISY